MDVEYGDTHVRKAFVEGAPDDVLDWSPPWRLARMQALGDGKAANISITGDPEPDLLADVDGDRVGRAVPKELQELGGRLVLDEQLINWTVVAFPNEGWAERIFGEPDVERLWEAVAFAVRLDETDPVAAWREHLDRLSARAKALNARESRPAALPRRRHRPDDRPPPRRELRGRPLPHLVGPGARAEHADRRGLRRARRAPDGGRRPLDAPARPARHARRGPRAAVRGRPDRRRAGRARRRRRPAQTQRDEGAARLGEVALVDGSSRVGQTGLVFYDTLFDENATCHIAYGKAITRTIRLRGAADGRT